MASIGPPQATGPADDRQVMQALLGLVAALAAIVLIIAKARAQRAAAGQPGATPATAIAISDFSDIDATVAAHRCRCGGRYRVRGEGPAAASPALRRVAAECRECERERAWYFDLTAAGATAADDFGN